MMYPGQLPVDLPVAGHGLVRLKSFIALALRWMRPLLSRGQVSQRGDANASVDTVRNAAMTMWARIRGMSFLLIGGNP